MFLCKKKERTKTEIITTQSHSQDVVSSKDCKKLILDNTRWEASILILIKISQISLFSSVCNFIVNLSFFTMIIFLVIIY